MNLLTAFGEHGGLRRRRTSIDHVDQRYDQHADEVGPRLGAAVAAAWVRGRPSERRPTASAGAVADAAGASTTTPRR